MEGSRPVKGGKLEMDNPVTRISVRNLVEFLCRGGDIDAGSGLGTDVTAMQEGARIHRLIQHRMGSFRNKWAETTEQRLLCG